MSPKCLGVIHLFLFLFGMQRYSRMDPIQHSVTSELSFADGVRSVLDADLLDQSDGRSPGQVGVCGRAALHQAVGRELPPGFSLRPHDQQ